MSRTADERTINDVLYGVDTEEGRDLLMELIAEMGTSALTDEAVHRLARKHEERHEGNIDRLTR